MTSNNMETCKGFDDIVKMIGGKWKLIILRKLTYGGTIRFNALRKSIAGISQTMLTKKLRELEADGLVTRRVFPEVPPRVEYTPTKKTNELKGFFQAMFDWASKNVP